LAWPRQPSDGVDLAQYRLQPLADLDEQLVAVMVAEGVVDLLEPVQIDQQQRRRDQFPVGLVDRLAGSVAQQRTWAWRASAALSTCVSIAANAGSVSAPSIASTRLVLPASTAANMRWIPSR
jgi:hypothetical protein